MKSIVGLSIFVILFSITISAQPSGKTPTKKPVAKKAVNSLSAEAAKAWNPFWREFATAIRDRDTKALEKLMSTDFEFHLENAECSYFAENNYNSNYENRYHNQKRAFAIQKFSDSKCNNGWTEIDRIVSHGKFKTQIASKTNEFMDEKAGTIIRYFNSSGEYKYGLQSYEHIICFRFSENTWSFFKFRWIEHTV